MALETVAAGAAHTDLSLVGLFFQADLFVKLVMVLLLGMSVMSWAVWFTKHREFSAFAKRADDFEDAFWNNTGLEDLYKHTQPEDTDHAMAKLYVMGNREYEKSRELLEKTNNKDSHLPIDPIDRVRRTLDATTTRELEKAEEWLPFLATVGSTAPFIGLLGTVWGIMNSFQNIGATKNTSLAVVAPGIAEALFATAIGLFAAIPAVMAYNKLSTDLARYTNRLEAFCTDFLNLLERKHAAQNEPKLKRAV